MPSVEPSATDSPTTPATSLRKRSMQPQSNYKDSNDLAHKPSKTNLPSPSKKRRRTPTATEGFSDIIDLTKDETKTLTSSAKKINSRAKVKSTSNDSSLEQPIEKRLRRHRDKAPQSFLDKLGRARTQRMIVIGRTRSDAKDSPQQDIDLVGSTGNIYRVTIGRLPSCTCPDHQKGNECKHKVYVMHNVLKAPEHLQYQLAYLFSELREIFAGAPPIPTECPSSHDTDGRRKPIEGECPICYFDFDEKRNELVWCETSCGNNMHKSCFDQWAASARGGTVKCVYCRAPWPVGQGDLKSVAQSGVVNEEGYVNVAGRFGMSGVRDYTSYHRPWVRRQMGYGW